MPKVSVIIPCYNQGEYVDDAVDSVLAQTFQEFEIIIVNDGSTDDFTNEKLRNYNKPKTKVIHTTNQGLSAARNNGIHASNGEYILPLDADDLIGADYIEKAQQRFQNFPDTKLVYCKAQFFGDRVGKWNLADYDYEALLFENIIFCTAMYKKKNYFETTGYNENMIQGYEDWDFWLALLNEFDIVYTIPDVCFYYRIRDQSMLGSLTEKMSQDLTRIIYNNHKEKYEKYLNDIIWMNQKIKRQQNAIAYAESEIKRIQISKAYRLGKFILKPFSALRNRFV